MAEHLCKKFYIPFIGVYYYTRSFNNLNDVKDLGFVHFMVGYHGIFYSLLISYLLNY